MRVHELFEQRQNILNLFKDLKSLPDPYKNKFSVANMEVRSLDGCPKIIEGYFDCSGNSLTSLIGGPEECQAYDCSNNMIKNLDGIAKIIKGSLRLEENSIMSFKNIHKLINRIDEYLCYDKKIKNGYIDILKIVKSPNVIIAYNNIRDNMVDDIINKHLKNPNIKERVQEATFEFIDNDLEEFI